MTIQEEGEHGRNPNNATSCFFFIWIGKKPSNDATCSPSIPCINSRNWLGHVVELAITKLASQLASGLFHGHGRLGQGLVAPLASVEMASSLSTIGARATCLSGLGTMTATIM